MFLLLNTKTIRFVIFSFVFFRCLITVFAQEESLPVLPQNAVDAERDLNAILLGMKHYNAIIRSGEGECTYSFEPSGTPDAHITWKAHLIFNRHQTRMDFEESISSTNGHWPKTTFIVTETGTWQTIYHGTGEQSYYFGTEAGLDPLRIWVDPRRWLHVIDQQDLPTYLKERNFHIATAELFDDMPCYVLEANKDLELSSNQQKDSFERFWISPERGLHYVKYENRFLRKRDSSDGKIKKGTPSVRRVSLFYELHAGDVWFVKNGVSESFWIDPDGEEYLVSRTKIETHNFRVNHDPLPEIFTLDLPNNARIRVEELDKKLSKKEFRQWYGEIDLNGIKLIKD